MPGTVPKKVKKNPTMRSEDSLGHDYLANKDFIVMELILFFFFSPTRGSKSYMENQGFGLSQVMFPFLACPKSGVRSLQYHNSPRAVM